MPIYEYECQECGFQHEVLQKISDDLLVTCPSCGADALKKLVSAAGFRLSGSGWYETDFKSGNQKNISKKDSQKDGDKAKKDKSSDTSKKADTKSPAKTTSKPSASSSS